MGRGVLNSSAWAVLMLALGGHAVAAEANAPEAAGAETVASVGEVIVTARKRSETDLSVPIAITAVDSTQLARRSISNLSDLAMSTPNLVISTNSSALGGGVALRGVGSGTSGSFASEAAVAITFDGITATNNSAMRFAIFDTQQIEVLKGPQSLYYGKNTSAGLISVTSADPTRELYAMGRVGYVFEGDERRAEGVISGPISDAVSARLALFYDDLGGYFRNPLPAGTVHPTYGLLSTTFRNVPNVEEKGARLTIKIEPNDRLSVRLKGTYQDREGSPASGPAQLYYCPTGSPQSRGAIPGVGDCVLNHTAIPYAAALPLTGQPGFLEGSSLYNHDTQVIGVANVDYKLTDELTLNSVTGYYHYKSRERSNCSYSSAPICESEGGPVKTDYSEEMRLTSSFSSPVNFMVGGLVGKSDWRFLVPGAFGPTGAPPPTLANTSDTKVRSELWSVFGQLIWNVSEKIELSGGARYTSETKKESIVSRLNGPIALTRPSRTYNALTPEVSLSYKPTSNINLFVSYREGAKSGNFNVSSFVGAPINRDYSYDDEKVSGFEGGVKSTWLDRSLRLDLIGFSYDYKDLQTASYNPALAQITVLNAGTARSRGVELNLAYSLPSVPGLKLSASVNYTRTRFDQYMGPCYVGQTIAQGCKFNLNPAGTAFLLQDYHGRPLVKSPDWSNSLQAEYTRSLTNGTSFALALAGQYSSGYYPQAELPPESLQKGYWQVDGSIRLFSDNDRWEVALIGRNLTDDLRIQQGVGATFTPAPGVAPGTGTAGPGHGADLVGFSNRPRSIEVRVTVKY